MKDVFSGCAAVLLFGFVLLFVVALGLGGTWIAQGNEFFLAKVFNPRMEDVRRETFEHSKAYRQGVIQEVSSMQLEYIKANDEHKQAIASIVLRRVADFQDSDLPADVRAFVNDLRRQRDLGR